MPTSLVMSAAWARWAYSTLLRLLAPLYVLRLLWRSRHEPPYRQRLAERFGFAAAPAAPGRIWLHAVSLGETRAAAPLIDEMRRQRPALALLLTHGTATGLEAGAALLREGDAQAWLPYDTPGAVRRFLRRHRPVAGVVMETEIWPNLLHEAARAGVPMVLANARLSERSARKGRRLAALMRPAAGCLMLALAQTEADAARLRDAGVRDVRVLGNLKFDLTPAEALLHAGRRWRQALGRPVVLLAVSREGEEAALLTAWRRVLPVTGVASVVATGHDRPLLLIVPRHPQRFDEVAALVRSQGLTIARRSAFGSATDVPPPAEAGSVDVWLGDSMREMPLYYALADVALLGGSFAPLGGQNLIEAAACGCPLLMGPHTFNFEQAAEGALAAGAAERAADLDAALAKALQWLADRPALAVRAESAQAFAASHRGAAVRMAEAVLAQVRR
ncbi:MAG: 3-deoxy-D-manno-octulosonic acid transferase [Rubrivivax sp.]|nr:3-deoxy-D-manno-octulosonic acid transferase [Rubrivivax sp.]